MSVNRSGRLRKRTAGKCSQSRRCCCSRLLDVELTLSVAPVALAAGEPAGDVTVVLVLGVDDVVTAGARVGVLD